MLIVMVCIIFFDLVRLVFKVWVFDQYCQVFGSSLRCTLAGLCTLYFNFVTVSTLKFNTGLITSITDANGNTSSYEYDILGRVTKKINPDLAEKEAIYNDQNSQGRVTK